MIHCSSKEGLCGLARDDQGRNYPMFLWVHTSNRSYMYCTFQLHGSRSFYLLDSRKKLSGRQFEGTCDKNSLLIERLGNKELGALLKWQSCHLALVMLMCRLKQREPWCKWLVLIGLDQTKGRMILLVVLGVLCRLTLSLFFWFLTLLMLCSALATYGYKTWKENQLNRAFTCRNMLHRADPNSSSLWIFRLVTILCLFFMSQYNITSMRLIRFIFLTRFRVL